MNDDTIAAAKRDLRRSMRVWRDGLEPAVREAAAAAVASRLVRAVPLDAGARIAGYHTHRSELDVLPLLASLAAARHETALPAVVAPGRPLAFRRWQPGDAFVTNAHGIPEALPSAPPSLPTHLLVPLLAFDTLGFRLGYGGGYYDRTLAALRGAGHRVTAIGVAYDGQRVAVVPRLPTDEALDLVVTEAGVCGPGSDAIQRG